jgi:NADH:ubiquinone oxidoreductase subunit 3 (subunit A)
MAIFQISILIVLILSLLYIVSFIISISSKDYEKFSAYECGFEPIHSNARIKFDILYWIIGILYLIFDLELIFIFPLATILYNVNS